MKLEHSLIPYTKINPEWLKGLNIRHDTIKLEETIGVTSWDMGSYLCFLRSVSQGNRNRSKNKQIGPNQTHKLLPSKGNQQPIDWEKITANDVTDQGLISKICKQLIQHNINKQNPVEKWAKDLHRHFSREDIQMVKNHMKKCSALLIIREKQFKTTVRYHLLQVSMAIIKNRTNKDFPGSPLAKTPCS